jgi:hypothetical protein
MASAAHAVGLSMWQEVHGFGILSTKTSSYRLASITHHQLSFYSAQDRRPTYDLRERFGGYYGGRLNEFRPGSTYRPDPKLSFSVSQT